MTDPDRPCPHGNFAVEAQVIRITDGAETGELTGLQADIKVMCMDCGEPMRWTGLQAGVSSDRPMCSVDETELRAPLRPASADPDFGLGVPGYAVTWREVE
jgi:hypothetical protein